jgi:hypothetical protein
MTKRALVSQEQIEAPFSIGCFQFNSTGVEVHGRPTFHETQGAFDFVTRSVKCSGFWMVDIIRYIDSREDFGDLRDILISAETGLTEGSVRVYRSIGKKLPPENRVEGVPFGHHQAVASLEPDAQVEMLEKSKAEGWNQAELRAEVRGSKRSSLLKGKSSAVQQLAVTLHVSVEAPTFTKAADLAKNEIKKLLKAHGGHILEAKVASVKARK